MEVHAAHSPIHSFKDFLIHILAITVGLMIALGLDAGVEALHHHNQVSEARATIIAEIAANRTELEKQIGRLKDQQKTLESMQATVDSPRTAAGELHLNVSLAGLRRASYDTSETSGALALMDYSEASLYAETYQTQTIFGNVQDRAVLDTEMALISSLPGPLNSLAGIEKLSAPQLTSLAEKIRNYRALLVVYLAAAMELDDQYVKCAQSILPN